MCTWWRDAGRVVCCVWRPSKRQITCGAAGYGSGQFAGYVPTRAGELGRSTRIYTPARRGGGGGRMCTYGCSSQQAQTFHELIQGRPYRRCAACAPRRGQTRRGEERRGETGLRYPHVISQLEFKAQVQRRRAASRSQPTRVHTRWRGGVSESHKIAVIRDPLRSCANRHSANAGQRPVVTCHTATFDRPRVYPSNGSFLIIVDTNQPETLITVHHTNDMPVIVLFPNK
jgi:hypothetical protein